MKSSLSDLTAELRRFAKERDWDQFHSPKNLAAALSVETAEVLEHFQWLTEEQSRELPADKRSQIELELADVLLYLLRLSISSTSTCWTPQTASSRSTPRNTRLTGRAGVRRSIRSSEQLAENAVAAARPRAQWRKLIS